MRENFLTKNDLTLSKEIASMPYQNNTFAAFSALHEKAQRSFLLESVDIAPVYGQLSMFCVDPVAEVIGFADHFVVRALTPEGKEFIESFPKDFFSFCDTVEKNDDSLTGIVSQKDFSAEETLRTKRVTPATILTQIIEHIHSNEEHFGLYGATSYDFVRYFEDLPETLPQTDTPYFHFFLPGTLVTHDHIEKKAHATRYFFNDHNPSENIVDAVQNANTEESAAIPFTVGDLTCDTTQEKFENGVRHAQKLMHEGYLFEMVLSKKYEASFSGDPLGVYQKYRDHNPSPYMFFFNFGDRTLLGASPEMFARVDNGSLHTRPISGTAKRGATPEEDEKQMQKLLADPKEKSELDMLIDLGRNDVARVSKSGVTVSDYRFVEKYSRVMHTVAHVEGTLADGFTHLDAFFALLNAGTPHRSTKSRSNDTYRRIGIGATRFLWWRNWLFHWFWQARQRHHNPRSNNSGWHN